MWLKKVKAINFFSFFQRPPAASVHDSLENFCQDFKDEDSKAAAAAVASTVSNSKEESSVQVIEKTVSDKKATEDKNVNVLIGESNKKTTISNSVTRLTML